MEDLIMEAIEFVYIMLRGQKAKMDERGASAVEYGLLIAGIAALIVAVVFLFGGVIRNIFNNTCGAVSSTTGTGTSCG
jgi:pilus assembly protein Flp/PilA